MSHSVTYVTMGDVVHLHSRTTTLSPGSLRSATRVENTNILDLWAFSNDEINFCLNTLVLKVFVMHLHNASTEHLDHGVKLWKKCSTYSRTYTDQIIPPRFCTIVFLVDINDYKGLKYYSHFVPSPFSEGLLTHQHREGLAPNLV